MPHHTPLIATIVAGLTIAFALGLLAHRLRISPLVGYLLAGVLVGPFTPGFVANQAFAAELAEIGVILLMFGVGLHFSLKDLLSVRKIAIPGAAVQISVATALGAGLGYALGWPLAGSLVFGLSLSVASTVVLLRALQERRIVQTERGRIAVGWLIVEDLAMVVALVLLPALGAALAGAPGEGDIVSQWLIPLGVTLGKVAAFVVFMLLVGRRVVPWLMHYAAHTGSRELFRLAVLAVSLGIAFGAAMLFDVSFALGAFFAGMILAESELSQRAAEETLPLRDAFAVLFFVSVGMLFNPAVLSEQPWALVATVGIIVIGKSIAAYGIVRLFRHNNRTALLISAALAQIGEFSFILAGLGVGLGLLPEEGRDLILGGAIISIMLNPLLFVLLGRRADAIEKAALGNAPAPANEHLLTGLFEHVILVGYGRVGSVIAKGLDIAGQPFLVIETDPSAREAALNQGYEVIDGNAADPRVLHGSGLAQAKKVIVAIPDGLEAGSIVEEARRTCPNIEIIARAHSDAVAAHLRQLGADQVVMGEQEVADAILHQLRARGGLQPKPSEGAAPTPAPASTPRLMLSDPEWALLAGIRASSVGAGETTSREALVSHARALGAFQTLRLESALLSLIEKGCLVDLRDGRLRVTRTGYVAATNAPVT